MSQTEHIILPAAKPNLTRLRGRSDGMKYRLNGSASIYSRRYKKWCDLEDGFMSDGATWATDINGSWMWLGHDKVTNAPCQWACGTPCSAFEASQFLEDIAEAERRNVRRYSWKWATFLLGSWKNKRLVGWFK